MPFRPDFEDYPSKKRDVESRQKLASVLQNQKRSLDSEKLRDTVVDYMNIGADAGKSLLTGGKKLIDYIVDTVAAEKNSVPKGVRAAVAGAIKNEDKLNTLRQFYPDAKYENDEFTFNDPKLKKRVNLDDPGLSLGDMVGRIPDIAEVAGGIYGGGVGSFVGSGGGPPGMAAGATLVGGAGSAFGSEAGLEISKYLGEKYTGKKPIDTRTDDEKILNFITKASMNSLIPSIPASVPVAKFSAPIVGKILKEGAEDLGSMIKKGASTVSDSLSSLRKKYLPSETELQEAKKVNDYQDWLAAREAKYKTHLAKKEHDAIVGKLNEHLDENIAKGARLNVVKGRVTIPEVKGDASSPMICDSRYGDCGPAVLKNLYREFGLPNNLLTSDFLKSGLELNKKAINSSTNGNIVSTRDLDKMLQDFGVQSNEIPSSGILKNDFNYASSYKDQMLNSATKRDELLKNIDNALDQGHKVVVGYSGHKNGHVYAITGKQKQADGSERYITNGFHEYEYGKANFNPEGQPKGSMAIDKDLIFKDLGLEENTFKNISSLTVKDVSGIKPSFKYIQDPLKHPFSSPESYPANLNAKKLIDKHLERKDFHQKWIEERFGPINKGNTSLKEGLSDSLKKVSDIKSPPSILRESDPHMQNMKNKQALNQYLDENVAKGARLSDDMSRVTIPRDYGKALDKNVCTSKYGDCVPALVKNIYAEFGLPNNILTSKFMKSGLVQFKNDISPSIMSGGNIVGTKGGKGTTSMLDDFGIQHKTITNSDSVIKKVNNILADSSSKFTDEEARTYLQNLVIPDIDNALEKGNKIMIRQTQKYGDKLAGHVFLITGKEKGADGIERYIVNGRGRRGAPYEEGNTDFPGLTLGKRNGTEAVSKDVIVSDLGIGDDLKHEYNAPGFDIIAIKGIKEPLQKLQQDVYKHQDIQPVNLNSKKLLSKYLMSKNPKNLHEH